ncbi:hypothetical protein DFH08DRAFT_653052, partial [Mycena albidolilacea]
GSFEDDLVTKKYPLSWNTWEEFSAWLSNEENQNSIELRLVKTTRRLPHFDFKYRYICSRRGTGGPSKYVPKNPERSRKIPSKRTDCPCTLTVKRYPGRATVCASYNTNHDHGLGNDNVRFTRIPTKTREYI